MLIISSSWQNSNFFFYNSNSHTCHSSLGGQTLPFKFYFPLFKISSSDNSSTPLFCNFLYSFTSNEPKNSQVFLTSNMVGEILRFDHCRCLEKRLLKLLGDNPPFLIVPPPFRNLPPFQMKFFNPPLSVHFQISQPPPL